MLTPHAIFSHFHAAELRLLTFFIADASSCRMNIYDAPAYINAVLSSFTSMLYCAHF